MRNQPLVTHCINNTLESEGTFVSTQSPGLPNYPYKISPSDVDTLFHIGQKIPAGLPFRKVFIQHFQDFYPLHIYHFLFILHYRGIRWSKNNSKLLALLTIISTFTKLKILWSIPIRVLSSDVFTLPYLSLIWGDLIRRHVVLISVSWAWEQSII